MSEFRSSDGVRLAYRIDDFTDPWRTPDTVVLLHSAMSCGARLYAWVPRLARRYRVARLDLRGHGESEVPPPGAPLTIPRLVADVLEFMDHIGSAAAHLVGASAGGYLAQRLAMDHPQRVRSLALFASTPGFKSGPSAGWLPQIEAKGLRAFLAETITDRFPMGTVDPGLVEWFLDLAARNDPRYIARFIALMAQQDWSDELGRIRCPTLVVIPGLGKIGDNAAYEPMRQRIPDVTMKTYEGMPHNIFDSAPDRCVDDLVAFLAARFDRAGGATAA